MRKASSNWLGKIVMGVVMGVLIISFGIWGIADIFKGFGQSTLAKVGRTEISTEQFRQIYTDKLQQIGRQFGRPLTQEQARAFGFDRQVLQQTIAEAALDEEARRMGLAMSEAEVMRMIYNDPNFKGIGGQFDPAPLPVGAPPVRLQRTALSRRAEEGFAAPADRRHGLRPGSSRRSCMIDALTRFQNEQRSIDYIKLDAAQAGTIDPPSPETLAAYFEERKVQFRAPEYRKLSFTVITPDEIGKWSEVSDEEARKVFDQRKDKLGTPEKREVSQIIFPNMGEAQAARAKIASGTVVRGYRQGARPQAVRLRTRPDREIRDP